MKINVSIQGIASRILTFGPSSTLWRATNLLDSQTLQKTLFEGKHSPKLKFHSSVSDYANLDADSEYLILDSGRFNRIEFKREGGRVQKLFVRELNNDNYLLPIFHLQTEPKNLSGLIIIERELGCFGQASIDCDSHFNILDLQFTQTDFLQLNISGLTAVSYRDQEISWKKRKTLIQSRMALFLN